MLLVEAQITKRSENGELASDDDEDDSTHKGSHIPSLRDMSNNDDLARVSLLSNNSNPYLNNIKRLKYLSLSLNLKKIMFVPKPRS